MNPYLVRKMTGVFERNTSRAILPKAALASAIESAFGFRSVSNYRLRVIAQCG